MMTNNNKNYMKRKLEENSAKHAKIQEIGENSNQNMAEENDEDPLDFTSILKPVALLESDIKDIKPRVQIIDQNTRKSAIWVYNFPADLFQIEPKQDKTTSDNLILQRNSKEKRDSEAAIRQEIQTLEEQIDAMIFPTSSSRLDETLQAKDCLSSPGTINV
uniref:Uncharacterized protein n=1 Tax=Romanomermis culicivorax TaxID=13658 RepID=A0A915HHR7_ROMCU